MTSFSRFRSEMYICSVFVFEKHFQILFFMYFHLYFEDFLKKNLYLYLYLLIEKNSDFKYKYI